jgi:hypothetical protein
MRTFLSGTEVHTLELGLSIDPDRARSLAGELEPDLAGGHGRGDVLFFAMRRLGVTGVPLVRFSYGEALFRLSVTWQGQPAWLALACDLDRKMIQVLGRWLVRYPVRPASFELDAAHFAVRAADGALVVDTEAQDESPEALPPRPLLVRVDSALYRIPWREDPAPWRRTARCMPGDDALAQATFGGAVTFDATGTLHRGRVHRCGIARRVHASPEAMAHGGRPVLEDSPPVP